MKTIISRKRVRFGREAREVALIVDPEARRGLDQERLQKVDQDHHREAREHLGLVHVLSHHLDQDLVLDLNLDQEVVRHDQGKSLY